MSNLKDFATSTVLTPPSPAISGGTLIVQAGHGARFPAAPFYATVHPPSEFPTVDNSEKLLVTAKSTDTFTITRGEGDTNPVAIEAGWRISNAVFLSDLTDSANVAAAGAVMESDTTTAAMGFVLDEDTFASNSDTKLATQQSIKAYVDAAIASAKQALMPVGTIVALGVSTNPATLYGFGTWTAIDGKVIVGKSASGTFNTLDATGGAETVTLAETHIPAHTHGERSITGGWTWHGGEGGSMAWAQWGIVTGAGRSQYKAPPGSTGGAGSIGTIDINATHTHNSFGGGQPHNNLQPYVVKYLWQRTA